MFVKNVIENYLSYDGDDDDDDIPIVPTVYTQVKINLYKKYTRITGERDRVIEKIIARFLLGFSESRKWFETLQKQ